MSNKKLILTQIQLDLPGITKEEILFQGLFDDKRLIEVSCEKKRRTLPLGTVVVGRVENIVPAINGAFIRISQEELAYLPMEEAHNAIFCKKSSAKKLCIGDELILQISKEPIKSKGASLRGSIQIPGKYMVAVTDSNSIQISKKIHGEQRKTLKNIFSDIRDCKDNEKEIEFGVIVRTNAAYASEDELCVEYQELSEKITAILKVGQFKSLYSILYYPESTVLQRIRDFLPEECVDIITDERSLYEEINSSGVLTKHLSVRYYEDNYGLNKLYSISEYLDKALRTKVWLKSGAYLVIEPTEALTVIDVNSGKNIKKNKDSRYYFDINSEAAEEIFYQLQLRNISGIIVVDFIDMPEESQRQELIRKLSEQCKHQRIPTSFVEMTKLNLAHIVRKKVYPSLREQVKE